MNGEGPAKSGTSYLTGVVDISAGNGASLAMTEDGYDYGWGRNDTGELGIGATGNIAVGTGSNNNTSVRPALVGGRAADLVQITTGELDAGKTVLPADPSDSTALNTKVYGQSIVGANNPELQASIEAAITNNPANDTRGRVTYYAPEEVPGKAGIYGGELPAQVDMTASQTLVIDATKVIVEQYKGYNLFWDVTTYDYTNDANINRLHWYSSDPGIITVTETGNKITVSPTGQRAGRAVVYVKDDTNDVWGSLTVNVYHEGLNTDSDPIVSNAKVISGDNFTYAIQWDGTVWAWGNNSGNYMGVSTSTNNATPAGSFTWKYYSHADLAALVAADSSNGYYAKLLEVSAGNSNGGAMVITGLTTNGESAHSLNLPTTLSKVGGSYDIYLGTGTVQPSSAEVPVVGIENDGNTFQNGSFTNLTVNESIRAIDSQAFDGCTGFLSMTWNVGEVADRETVYVAILLCTIHPCRSWV